MMNLLKESVFSTLDSFLGSLGLERKPSLGRQMTPAFSWLIVGAAAGGAASAWLMSESGQQFIKRARERVAHMGDELRSKRQPSDGSHAEEASMHGKTTSSRTQPRATT